MPPSPIAPAPASPKRDHLVATAEKLFYRDGYRAVGIDTLLEKAGVAKMTLYNHFVSKDDLIIAVLEKRSAELLRAVDLAIAGSSRAPLAQLSSVFEGLKAWFAAEDFKGCAFLRAISEFPEPDHPIHRAAWRHKRAVNARIRSIAAHAGAKDPGALADTISLLIDGAIVAAHATGSAEPADRARAAAAALLKLAV